MKNLYQNDTGGAKAPPLISSLTELVNGGFEALVQNKKEFEQDDLLVLKALIYPQAMNAKTADSYKRILVEFSEYPGTILYEDRDKNFKNTPIKELLDNGDYKFAVAQGIRNKASNLKTSISILQSLSRSLQKYTQFSEKVSEVGLRLLQVTDLAELNINSATEKDIGLASLIFYYYNPGHAVYPGVFQSLLDSQVKAKVKAFATSNPYVEKLLQSAIKGDFVEGFFKNCIRGFDY